MERPLCRGLEGGTATAMSIQFAPESNPTAFTLELDEEQTTGPLALGFEFELFGVHYTRFEISSNGFIAFGTDSSPCCFDSAQHLPFIPLDEDLSNFITLGCIEAVPPGRRRIAYEVRGMPQRRRLVLSLTAIPNAPEVNVPVTVAQVVLHERTGMIDVHTKVPVAGGPRNNEAAVRFTTYPVVRARATA
jgi:hypothetical protein